MKPLMKPLSEGLSRQKTAAKSLLIPFGIAKAERCIFALPRIAAKAAPTNAAR